MLRRAVLALAACASLTSVGPFAQQVELRKQTRTFQTWLDAVNAHVPGERDAAVLQIAPWLLIDLDSVIPGLRRQPLLDQLSIVERALVLHADTAILNRVIGRYNLPEGPESATIIQDGRAVGLMGRTVQWEFARRLLDQLPEGATRERIGREFYYATAAVLQRWGEFPELTAHFSAARRLLGDDAVLLMYEGTMHQSYAGPRMQRFYDDRRRARARGVFIPLEILNSLVALPSAGDSRSQAERLFRHALTIDPALAEARIRLAHMLGDRGRHQDAALELERAMKQSLPVLLDYYASLLTGRHARALGQLQAARVAFERAARIAPNALAPKYGLSELARAQSRSSESLAYLLQNGGGAPNGGEEPWWWIDRAHDPSAQTLIDGLRRLTPR